MDFREKNPVEKSNQAPSPTRLRCAFFASGPSDFFKEMLNADQNLTLKQLSLYKT